MNDVYVIFIAPFDLFGQDKYMYTFQMTCQEIPGLVLNDGAVRIFLNTHGKMCIRDRGRVHQYSDCAEAQLGG